MFLIFSLPSIFFLILLLLVLIGVGFLGLVIKVKQVAFVGEIEVLDWRLTEWIQFLAFLNNMLALDLSKDQSLKATLNFLFGGQDAIQDMNEMKAKEKFLNMLVAHSTLHNGFLKTIVVLPQLGSVEIQQICLEETKKERPLKKRINSSRFQTMIDIKDETRRRSLGKNKSDGPPKVLRLKDKERP